VTKIAENIGTNDGDEINYEFINLSLHQIQSAEIVLNNI